MVTKDTFYCLPSCSVESAQLAEVDIAILGIPHATAYDGNISHSAGAPQSIRAVSCKYPDEIDHFDFDLEGSLLSDNAVRVVDCGDLPGNPKDPEGNVKRIVTAVKTILGAGAVPVILGGDDSVPIPFFSAFEDKDQITIVQIDAHIDWRHEVHGVTRGYSSTMRRASEMPWIEKIVQAGMRGVGSARAQEVADARAYGAVLVTAKEIAANGVQAVLDHIPAGSPCILTIDCDGLDPSVMPAVLAPSPGGLTYQQVIDIIHAIPKVGKLVGFDLVEFAPQKDVGNLGAITASRIVCNVIGTLARHYPA